MLVTGATGFIGLRCVHALEMLGAEVMALGRRPKAEFAGNTTYLSVDLEDRSGDQEWLDRFSPEYVLHLASPPDQASSAAVERQFARTMSGSIGLLGHAARLPDVKGIVLAGSVKSLGKAPAPYGEDAPALPTSSYGVAKAAESAFAFYLRTTLRVPICVLRLTAVYGPGQPSHTLIGQACRSAILRETLHITSGQQIREFLFLDDAVRALLVGLAHAHNLDACTFNVGSGEAVTVLDVAQRILALAADAAEIQIDSVAP